LLRIFIRRFLVLFVFYARQKPEKTRRAQKPNSLPLKTHYPLCLFMTFHLKRSLGAGCVFICCHPVKRTQYDNAYIQLAEIYYPAAHAQLDESNEEQSHNSWGTNSAEDNIKRGLPKKQKAMRLSKVKIFTNPKTAKKSRKIEEKTEAQRLLLLLLLYFNWDLPI